LAILALENCMAPPERRLVTLSEVAPEQIRWLWRDRIPVGAIALLEGDPGLGKSTITYDLAAKVTAGLPMPGCSTADEPAGVVLLQAEDNLAATVRPNLEAAGANLGLVKVYDQGRFADRPLVLPDDLEMIETAAAEVRARLLVIDPWEAFLAGEAKADHRVRRALRAVAAFAQRANIAVLLVRHLVKSPSGNVLYRGVGSIAIIAAARSVLMAANDPACADPNRHVLVQTKSNLSRATSLTYRTTKLGSGVRLEWVGESACTARNLVDAGATDQSALGDAMWILYTLLRERPLPAREVYPGPAMRASRRGHWSGPRKLSACARAERAAALDRAGCGNCPTTRPSCATCGKGTKPSASGRFGAKLPYRTRETAGLRQRETTSFTWMRCMSVASSSCRSSAGITCSAPRTPSGYRSWSSWLTTAPRAMSQPRPLSTISSSSWAALPTGRPV
jgi:hypothetical protein